MQHSAHQPASSTAFRAVGWIVTRTYEIYVLGTVAGFILAVFGVSFFGIPDRWIARFLTASIGLLVTIMLVFLIVFAFNYSRKARYADIQMGLHEMQVALRELQSKIRAMAPASVTAEPALDAIGETIRQDFRAVLSQVAAVYSLTSATSCRVAIKFLGRIDASAPETLENLYVSTLARDPASTVSCREKDAKEGRLNRVTDNTDFTRLLRGVDPYFHSPNVNAERHYDNSSEKYWREARPVAALIEKSRLRWPSFLVPPTKYTSVFPYSSVITIPIKGDKTNGYSQGFVAFLCIDALSRAAFWERYDVPLGANVADSLYHPLLEYGTFMANTRERLRRDHGNP